MKITDVKIYPVNEDKLKAFATIVFDIPKGLEENSPK